MRNITIEIEGPDFIELACNTDPVDLTETIGYLCTWGITGGYDTVRIFMDLHSKTDLVALYTFTDDPTSKYVMGAVWRKDDGKFTFHS